MILQLDSDQTRQLVKLLLDCRSVANSDSRKHLTGELPRLKGCYPPDSINEPIHDVTRLVNFCIEREGVLEVFVDLIGFYDQYSEGHRAVVDYLQKLYPEIKLAGPPEKAGSGGRSDYRPAEPPGNITGQTIKPEESEQDRLLRELENPATTHARRKEIGERLDALGDTRPGVGGRGDDGLPDIEWLPVAPGGKLMIESRTYTIEPFYIARYPVTYAQYQGFVEAGDGFYNPKWWQEFPKEYRPQKLAEQRNIKAWNSPRDNVSWYQAVAFSRWLNERLRGWPMPGPVGRAGQKLVIGENAEVRLPTEWEWQWAAQGGNEKRAYPWGAWQEGCANTREAGLGQTIAVGMYPHGAAACGAMDMSGQVLEWYLNKYSKERPYPVQRGGSFNSYSKYAACAYRNYDHPNSVFNYFGFRVVVASPMRHSDL